MPARWSGHYISWHWANSEVPGQVLRFLIVGGVTTSVNFMLFVGLYYHGIHFVLAALLAWLPSIALSYGLNRVLTFRVTRGANFREFGDFLAGAMLQLVLASLGYVVLIDGFGLGPTAAFCINLSLTACFSFAFMRLIVFCRGRTLGSSL